MYSMSCQLRNEFRAARLSAPVLAALLTASPAIASIDVTSQITNTYGFVFGSGASINQITGGDSVSLYQGNTTPATQSELGLNYTAYATSGGFYFLHDEYCVGICATASSTTITFTLTNNGNTAEMLRFDSQITPGHLARIGNAGTTQGAFQFTVKQVESGFDDSPLYQASGAVGPETIFVNSGLIFNGLKRTTGAGFEVYDWGKTNLSVPLRVLNPGETTQLVYQASYTTQLNTACTNIFQCGGVEVAFGDPRNDGGVTNAADLADALLNSLDPRPVIGGSYAPSLITASFVPLDSDIPPPQDPFTAPTYNKLFQSHVLGVPEPATWAMMLAGFGLVGSTTRRRRRVALAFD